ncbi:MAG: MBG domain-containing protein [Niveispirillum sp.]|uniref:MBG domain-containing protein n=1 Tax=Niveispirillum sp. TaxID=1917217 RepID=UPI003BA523A5
MATDRRQREGQRRWRHGFRALTLASVFTLPAAAQTPQGATVVVGGAGISSQGNQTLITQTTDRALIDWRRFDIGQDAAVAVTQPGVGSILVNRVTGNGTATRIDGSLTANGQVVVIDKAGVVIGRGARVDAGAFLATTADIDNADFAAGRLIFGKAGQAGAAIVNEGTIRVADAGYAVLAAPEVRNSGVVAARLGRVVLAGAERFTLDLAGDGLLRFELPADLAGRVVNEGSLTGATILMTARAARDGMAGVVNAGGLVEATRARQVDGRIIIGGADTDTQVTGAVTAAGGSIDILGEQVALTGARVDASGPGDGGQIRIGGDFQGSGDLPRARTTRIDAGSVVRADGADGSGGRVIIWSDGRTDHAGAISARGTRDGGFAEVSGKGSLRFAGTADLAGGAGGKAGELLLDPTNITIGATADVDGNSTTGDDIPADGSIGSGDYSGVDSLITAAALANLLNAGTSVTLAASNDIMINSSITKTGGTGASLSLTAGRDLTFASGVGVTSSSGALSMGFTAGRSFTATNGSFTSNGGSISVSATGTGATTGINLSGVSVNSGAGAITLTGTGSGTGILLDSAASVIASSGAISVTGSGVNGIMAQGSSVVRAGSGTMTLIGTGGSGGTGITVNGSATFGGATQSGRVILAADDMALAGATIRSSGTVNLRTRSDSRDLIVGGTDDTAGLALSSTELATVTAATLSLGHSSQTGALTVSATPSTTGIGALELISSSLSLGSALTGLLETFLNVGKDATVETAGALNVTDSIAKTAGGDAALTLRAGGNLTFTSAIGATSGSNRLSMDFSGGYSTTGSVSASGAASFTSNGGTIGFSGRTGLALSGSSITAGAGTITLAGGDIALSTTAITSTGRVILRPYAAGGQMSFGGAASGVTNVSQAELNQISAGVVRLGALDGGNLVISSALSHASDTVELASAGNVTQTADINVTSLSLLGTGGSYSLTRSGNSVTTLAANTGSFDMRSGASLAVGTVAGTTGLTFTGNASLYAENALITLGQAALYAGSGTGTLTLSSHIDVTAAADAGVSNGGKLNIVLAADGNAGGSPGRVAISNATLSTNGGNITIGSGSTPATRAAEGKSDTGIGVNILSSTLNSGAGGAILINGQGAASGTNSATGIGINVSASSLIAGGSGTITLNGTGGAGNALTAGIAIGDGSTIRTASGALAINGEQASSGTNRYGILLRNDPTTRSALYSTSSGGVELRATGTDGRIAAHGGTGDSSRAYIGWDGTNAYAGTTTLTADRMVLTSATDNAAISIGGSGNLVLKPVSTGASIGLGDGAVGSNDLELGQAELDTLRAGFGSIVVGQSTGTGTITASGAAFKDNTTIQGGTGAVTLSGALSTGTGNDAGSLSLETKGLLTVGSTITTQNQNITLMADRLALTGTVNAGTATATLTTATASRTIDLGSTTNAASALEISAAELNQVTAGVIRVGASNAGAISVTQAITPTGSNSLHLRSGGGITQSGAITVSNLAVTAGGTVALASVNNAVGSFAVSASNQNVALRDDTGFAIATLDNVAGVSLGTGTLSLTSTGSVTQTASVSASGLALAGAGGAYTLAHASNAVTTIAAQTGSVDLAVSGATSIGSAGTLTGITTTGTVKLSSGGNLSIVSGATVSATGAGDALVLAANGTFTNNGGANALSVSGGGRFLVFSSSPLTSSTGGISALPYYNRSFTFGDRTYAALTNSGNRFVYSYAPSLTVTPDAVNQTYSGATFTGSTYTITGLVTGDTLSNAVSGTGTITGSGRNAGTYTLTAGAGTLASDLGYGFSYGTGTLTVARKDLTYAVANGSVTYGTLATNGAVTLTGVVDGDSVAGTVTTWRGSEAESLATRTDVGSLTQKVTALTGTDAGNYQIASAGNTDGTLTIGQKALTYVIAAANAVYGTLATLGTATLNGLVDGDTVTTSVGLSGATHEARLAAGTYGQTVALGGADAGNYSLAGTGNSVGQLTVARKSLTYAVSDVNSTYGTLATLSTPSLTGVLMGDTVTAPARLQSGTLSARLAAGDYTLVLGDLTGASAGNYVLAGSGHTTGTLRVARKSLTATIATATSTYGTTASTGAVSFTGVLDGDTVGAAVALSDTGGTVALSPTLDAGSYTQTVTGLTGSSAANYELTGGPVTAGLTINRKDLTYAVANGAVTYGTLAGNGAVTLTGVVNGDDVGGMVTTYRNGTVENLAIRTPVGTLTQRVTSLTGTDATNYQIAGSGHNDGILTIAQKALTYTVTAANSVYGTLATLGSATLTGVVDEDSVTASVGLSGGTLSAKLAAGTYDQTITLGGSDLSNYRVADSGNSLGTLTVARKALTYSIADATTPYGTPAALATPGLTGVVEGDGVGAEAILQGGTLADRLSVGSYTLVLGELTGAAASNYVIATGGNRNGTLTVTPKALTASIASVTSTYGQAAATGAVTLSGILSGDDVRADLVVEGAGGTVTPGPALGVGTYTQRVTGLLGGSAANYTLSDGQGATASLRVNPATLTILADNLARLYGAADPSLTYQASGLVNGDTITGSLARVAGQNVGTYGITQGSLTAGANYTISFQGGALTINPAPLTITAASVTRIYGDADPALSYSTTGLLAGDGVTGDLRRAAGEDVGRYAIEQGSLSAGRNYDITFQAGQLTITPAALTVTASAATRVYMDADPDLTYAVTGLKRGDGVGTALSGALTRAAGEDVGLYAISQGSLTANANYTLRFNGADFRITPASLSLSVVAANASKLYGDADPVFGFTASGLKGKDTLAGVLSGGLGRVAGEDVGTYAINQGSLTVSNPNYVLAFTPGTLTISPANLSVAALMVTRTYGDADPSLTYSVSGLKRGDNAGAVLTGALSRAGGEDAGTYAIGPGNLALTNGNYTLSFTGAQLTINPALLSVTANAVSRLYGAADPALTYAVSGLKRGDGAGAVLSGTLTRVAGGTVGRYAIGQGSLLSNGNYQIRFQGADLTINPAPLSVLVDNATRQAGAANPVFTARFQGLVNGDTDSSLTGLSLRTLADTASPAGTYGISAGGITNANYQITYVDGVLTVTGGGVLPPAVAETVPVTTVTQPVRAPALPSVTVAAPAAAPAAPVAPPAIAAGTAPAPTGDGGSAALAAVNQSVQSASGSAADDDSAAEEMIPGLLSQQRRLPGETPEGTPGLEQQFPNLGRVW